LLAGGFLKMALEIDTFGVFKAIMEGGLSRERYWNNNAVGMRDSANPRATFQLKEIHKDPLN
jgi:hypothetical protein